MKAFGQLIMASVKDIVRDKMSLFWFLAFPIIFILIFGSIFSNEEAPTYNVAVVYESEGPLVHAIVAGMKAVPVFEVEVGTKEEGLAALKKGEKDLVVEIPAASSGIAPGGNMAATAIRLYYDRSQQTNEQVLIPIVRQVLDEIERHMTGRPRLFQIETEPIQGKGMRTIDFLLPGILGMALMQLGLFGSLRVVSLREQKILKNLGATPLPRSLFVISEVLVRICMALIQTSAIVVVGHLVFDVNVAGSWFLIVGVVLLGAVTFVGLGYLLISFARTEEGGLGVIQVVQFPMMFLSGVFFPVEIMPSFMRPVINVMPLTYLGDLLRQVMVNAPPLYSLSTDLLVLGSWAVLTLVLAVRFWRWE